MHRNAFKCIRKCIKIQSTEHIALRCRKAHIKCCLNKKMHKKCIKNTKSKKCIEMHLKMHKEMHKNTSKSA